MAKVILYNARLSFPDLFEAVQYQGQGPFQFRASFLVNEETKAKWVQDPTKSETGDAKSILDKVLEDVAKAKWDKKYAPIYKSIMATTNKCCFIDGDTKAYNGYAGHWAITATRNQDNGAPVVVDRAKRALSQKDGVIYAGCYVNATIEVWAQDNSFGKALRSTLVNVQFVKDGESFGGAAPASAADLDDLGYDEADEDEDLV